MGPKMARIGGLKPNSVYARPVFNPAHRDFHLYLKELNMPFVPVPKDKTWERKPCSHPEHNPPGHIVLPPGMHIWRCPACGKEKRFRVPHIQCKLGVT